MTQLEYNRAVEQLTVQYQNHLISEAEYKAKVSELANQLFSSNGVENPNATPENVSAGAGKGSKMMSDEEIAEHNAVEHARQIEEQNQANQETQWEREDSALQRKVRDGQALGLNPLTALGATGASSTTSPIENTMSEALMNQASGIHNRKAEKAQRIMQGVEMALGTIGKIGQIGVDAYDKKWKREHDVEAMKIDLLKGLANGVTGQQFANMTPEQIGQSLGEWISTQALDVFGAKPKPAKNGDKFDDDTPNGKHGIGKKYDDSENADYEKKFAWVGKHRIPHNSFGIKWNGNFYAYKYLKFTDSGKVILFNSDNQFVATLGEWK